MRGGWRASDVLGPIAVGLAAVVVIIIGCLVFMSLTGAPL